MSTSPPRVDILLSTYNGQPWLKKQLLSLQSQSHTNWKLWIRDDGSTDATIGMIESFVKDEPRAVLLKGFQENLGPARSFAKLLSHALDSEAQFFFFCDQDDEWAPQKIERCLVRLMENTSPTMVASDLLYCDSNLGHVHDSYLTKMGYLEAAKETTLDQLLCQNFLIGCTIGVNRSLATLAQPQPKEALMHDWWLALVNASAGGNFAFIDEPLLRYRVHTNNFSQAGGKGGLSKFLKHWQGQSFFLPREKQSLALKAHIERCLVGEARSKALDSIEGFLETLDSGRLSAFARMLTGPHRFQGTKRQLAASLMLLFKK